MFINDDEFKKKRSDSYETFDLPEGPGKLFPKLRIVANDKDELTLMATSIRSLSQLRLAHSAR